MQAVEGGGGLGAEGYTEALELDFMLNAVFVRVDMQLGTLRTLNLVGFCEGWHAAGDAADT